MSKEDNLRKFLLEVCQSIPANAANLRTTADSVIAKWINLGFEYPHDLMDNLVYIESSIERIMTEHCTTPLERDKMLAESYNFHIQSFVASLKDLQLYIDKRGPQLG